MIVRLDANGNKIWDKTFGGTAGDEISSARQTSDGGYILGGRSSSLISGNKTSTNYGGADGWVIRIDSSGNKLWEKTFGGTGSDAIISVEQTRDGGFMLGGYSYSGATGNKTTYNAGQNDWWVIQLNTNGTILNQQSFGGSDYEELYSMTQTRSGGFLLGGYSTSGISDTKTNANFGLTDMWLVRLPSTFPPQLNIARRKPGVEASWDVDYASWRLQATTNLLPTNWVNVTSSSFQTNGFVTIPFTNLLEKTFFRLKK